MGWNLCGMVDVEESWKAGSFELDKVRGRRGKKKLTRVGSLDNDNERSS